MKILAIIFLVVSLTAVLASTFAHFVYFKLPFILERSQVEACERYPGIRDPCSQGQTGLIMIWILWVTGAYLFRYKNYKPAVFLFAVLLFFGTLYFFVGRMASG